MEEVEVLYRLVIWEAAEGFSNVDVFDNTYVNGGVFTWGPEKITRECCLTAGSVLCGLNVSTGLFRKTLWMREKISCDSLAALIFEFFMKSIAS